MNLQNVEHDLLLTALAADNIKTSLTSLRSSGTKSLWDAFNDEIIFIAFFIPTCFLSTTCIKVFSWVSNLDLSRPLLKSKIFAKIHHQNLLHRSLSKAVFPLSEEFHFSLSLEIYSEYSWQSVSRFYLKLLDFMFYFKLALVLLNFRYKFCRTLYFLISNQNFFFLGSLASSFSKNILKLASSLIRGNAGKLYRALCKHQN